MRTQRSQISILHNSKYYTTRTLRKIAGNIPQWSFVIFTSQFATTASAMRNIETLIDQYIDLIYRKSRTHISREEAKEHLGRLAGLFLSMSADYQESQPREE